MNAYVAALPMYDFPELRQEVDAEWAGVRDRLRAQGVDAPERLARRNADLPPVPGGIRDASGSVIAPDPATLPPDEFDLFTLWRHPGLLFSQTCWGPLEVTGLAGHVRIIWQPDYSAYPGGEGEFYSSAVVIRAADLSRGSAEAVPPGTGKASLPLHLLRGRRLAFNNPDSMSGLIGIQRDLEGLGESLDIFVERIETGSHRSSSRALVEGRADVATIDCRTWSLIKRFEPGSARLAAVGWTARRKGLPYISAVSAPPYRLDFRVE